MIVLAYHLGHAIHCDWLFPKGYLAVDFFFMLSGYVLSRAYEKRLATDLTPIRFIGQRIRRLWPMMAAGTLLGMPLLVEYPAEIRLILVAAGLLFIPILAARDYFPLNGPQWSILFELFANGLHGLALHRLSTRSLAVLVAMAALFCGISVSKIGNLDIGGESNDLVAGFPRVIMGYGIGMLLWRILPDRTALVLPWWIAAIALPAAISATGMVSGHIWLAEMAFALIACPIIVALGVFWDPGAIGTFAGRWSFPLYAFHAPLIYGALSLNFSWPAIIGLVVVVSAVPALFQLRPRGQATGSVAV